MIQSVSRVPDALFDRSSAVPAPPLGVFGGSSVPPPPPPAPSSSGPLFKAKKSVLKSHAKTSSKASIVSKKSFGKGGKTGKAKLASSKSSASNRAGIIFPSARIKRRYKEAIPTVRVSKTSSIYTAAVLEYMTA